jgi:hypothetical protein
LFRAAGEAAKVEMKAKLFVFCVTLKFIFLLEDEFFSSLSNPQKISRSLSRTLQLEFVTSK